MQDTAALSTSDERTTRAALLSAPNFIALEAYRADIAARFGPTPHIDPLDGGVTALLLLLLETPGPRGDSPRFVSRDNPTGTARNLRCFLEAAGIKREETVLWNAVPWIIHAEGARNRAPRRAEIDLGLSLLPAFVDLLPHLQVVVMAGRVAQAATSILRRGHPRLTLLAMPHPSPTYVATSPSVRIRIAAALAEANSLLANGS